MKHSDTLLTKESFVGEALDMDEHFSFTKREPVLIKMESCTKVSHTEFATILGEWIAFKASKKPNLYYVDATSKRSLLQHMLYTVVRTSARKAGMTTEEMLISLLKMGD